MTTNLPIEKALLERNLSTDSLDVYIRVSKSREWVETMQPLQPMGVLREKIGECVERRPAFRLEHSSAEALMDAMWAVGIRPSSGDQGDTANRASTIAAMQAHINDLRVVAQIVVPKDRPATTAGSETY